MVLFHSCWLPFHLQLQFKSSILFTKVFISWFWLLEWPSFILWYTMVDGVSWVTWSLFLSTDWTAGGILSEKHLVIWFFTQVWLDRACVSLEYGWQSLSLLPTLEDHADGSRLFDVYVCHWWKVNYCVKGTEIYIAVHWYNTLGQHDDQNGYRFQTC